MGKEMSKFLRRYLLVIFFWKKWHWGLLTSCWEITVRKVELPEVGPHAASCAGCEQQSCVPKAWHLRTLHTLSSLLCASCCCQSTCVDVRPPTQPGRTALERTTPEGKKGMFLCESGYPLCGTGLFLPWVLQILCLSIGCRIIEIYF